MSVLHKRSLKGARTGRARLEPASLWRILAVIVGDDRRALRVDARRVAILEQQEAHHRCGQG